MPTAIPTLLGLLGGLALFLYGMNLMTESLQSVAGDRMKSILSAVTRNPVLGVLAGALATAVLQSCLLYTSFSPAKSIGRRDAWPPLCSACLLYTSIAGVQWRGLAFDAF